MPGSPDKDWCYNKVKHDSVTKEKSLSPVYVTTDLNNNLVYMDFTVSTVWITKVMHPTFFDRQSTESMYYKYIFKVLPHKLKLNKIIFSRSVYSYHTGGAGNPITSENITQNTRVRDVSDLNIEYILFTP